MHKTGRKSHPLCTSDQNNKNNNNNNSSLSENYKYHMIRNYYRSLWSKIYTIVNSRKKSNIETWLMNNCNNCDNSDDAMSKCHQLTIKIFNKYINEFPTISQLFDSRVQVTWDQILQTKNAYSEMNDSINSQDSEATENAGNN